MKKEFWSKLLSDWRKKGHEGLTIPYIIGSQKYIYQKQNTSNLSIKDVMKEIIENKDVTVYLGYCDTIGGVVLGIKDDSKKDQLGFYPKYKGLAQRRFFLTQSLEHWGNDIEDITLTMINEFQADIDSGKYSLNKGKKGDFSEEEEKFIKESYRTL